MIILFGIKFKVSIIIFNLTFIYVFKLFPISTVSYAEALFI